MTTTAARTDFFEVYGGSAPDLRLEEQEFRFWALRKGSTGKWLEPVELGRYTESCEWQDEATEDEENLVPMLRGQLSLRKPQPDDPGADLTIGTGTLIKCDVRWGGDWTELWRMRVQKPSIGVGDGAWTFELADDLKLMSESEGDFKFRKGKKSRVKGWYYHEIVTSVCRQFGIPVLKLTHGTKRLTFSDKSVSPLEVVKRVVDEEVKWSGRRLVIRWAYDTKTKRAGLSITPQRRNPYLYLFKEQIRAATLTEEVKAGRATALIATGSSKRGKKTTRKKVRVRVVSARGVARYGYIQKQETLTGSIDSVAEARRAAKKKLADLLKAKRIIDDFQHPGIAYVRRGDAVRISIPDEGYNVGMRGAKGKRRWSDPARQKGVVFVTAVTHSLSGGDYTMSLTLGFTDPLDPEKLREEREKAARARKRKSRGKKK